MKPVRTHTFKNGKYKIIEAVSIDGICDLPGDGPMEMTVLAGNSLRSLQSILHESLHANGLPSTYLDGDYDVTHKIAKLLLRMGWRRTEEV